MQVPTMCWVNVAIIDRLRYTDAFKKCCRDVSRNAGFVPPTPETEWPFMNLSWGAYMMYCLLVVPKELYELPNNDSFFKGLLDQQAMRSFTVNKERFKFEIDPSYHLSCLRNAVSHVHFRIDQQGKLTFWDHPPRKPDKRRWEVEIEHNDLIKFLHIMADAAHRYYVDIKEGRRKPPTPT